MAMYALGILPLIRAVATHGAKQVWHADDAIANGQLSNIRNWWDQLTTDGPSFGYYVNNEKSWLIVKEEHQEQAERIFEGTGIKITSEGKRHLGSALGTSNFVKRYVQKKVETWQAEIGILSTIAKSEPHTAYSALTHGLTSH